MLDTDSAFTLFTRSSDTSSAIPSTVVLGTISVSPLKFANMTYARSARRIALGLACNIACEDCRALGSMCVSARAGKMRSIGIWTGSTTSKWGEALIAFHFQSSLYYLSAPGCEYEVHATIVPVGWLLHYGSSLGFVRPFDSLPAEGFGGCAHLYPT